MKINAFSVVWNKYETKDAIICPKDNAQHYVEVCERCPYFKWYDVAPERVNCNFDKGEPYEPINKDCNELEPQYYFDKSTNNFLANEAR